MSKTPDHLKGHKDKYGARIWAKQARYILDNAQKDVVTPPEFIVQVASTQALVAIALQATKKPKPKPKPARIGTWTMDVNDETGRKLGEATGDLFAAMRLPLTGLVPDVKATAHTATVPDDQMCACGHRRSHHKEQEGRCFDNEPDRQDRCFCDKFRAVVDPTGLGIPDRDSKENPIHFDGDGILDVLQETVDVLRSLSTETATPDPDRPCIHCGKPEPEHYAYARGCTLLNEPGPLENCYYKPTPLSSSEVEALAEKIANEHRLDYHYEDTAGYHHAKCKCDWISDPCPAGEDWRNWCDSQMTKHIILAVLATTKATSDGADFQAIADDATLAGIAENGRNLAATLRTVLFDLGEVYGEVLKIRRHQLGGELDPGTVTKTAIPNPDRGDLWAGAYAKGHTDGEAEYKQRLADQAETRAEQIAVTHRLSLIGGVFECDTCDWSKPASDLGSRHPEAVHAAYAALTGRSNPEANPPEATK